VPREAGFWFCAELDCTYAVNNPPEKMKLKIPGFSRVSASLTRLVCVLGVVILGFLVYGFCIWLNSTAPKQGGLGAEDPRAFFARYIKTAGEGQAQSMADCLQLVALDSAVENFRAGAVRAADTKTMARQPPRKNNQMTIAPMNEPSFFQRKSNRTRDVYPGTHAVLLDCNGRLTHQ
jgi:hypothetical protein